MGAVIHVEAGCWRVEGLFSVIKEPSRSLHVRCFCAYGEGHWSLIFIVGVRPLTSFWGLFQDSPETAVCTFFIWKPLPAFVENIPPFSLQMPRLRSHPRRIWRGNPWPGHRGPLHFHSLKPRLGGPAVAGYHAVCGKVTVSFRSVWREGALFNVDLEAKTTVHKFRHSWTLSVLGICGIHSDWF